MSHQHYDYEDFEDLLDLPPIRNMPTSPSKQKYHPQQRPKKDSADVLAQLTEQVDREESFDFTYHASRHERQWIIDSLGNFYEQHWLDDVLRLLKGGKEAHVYQCLANSTMHNLDKPYLAAKVYRPRQFRNLKNDHLYNEGRERLDSEGRLITNDGMQHAMDKRTNYGLELLHTSWIEHEVHALRILHAAGADVPEPYSSGNNAILMTYFGGDDMPAPTLNTVDLDLQEARQLFERVLHNVELMLAHNRIHGDLSAYNILYWEGQITLIDFPQAFDPHVNRSAFRIFERDIQRVCEYFSQQGVHTKAHRLAADIWTAYGYRLAPDVHPSLLDAEDAGDRAYWRRITRQH